MLPVEFIKVGLKLLVSVGICEGEVCCASSSFRISELETHPEIMFHGFVGWRISNSKKNYMKHIFIIKLAEGPAKKN